MLKASICTIGDELLIGQVTDTNSGCISRALGAIGTKVTSMVSIPDDGARIISDLKAQLAENDIVITTGGLGPTKDDITKQALAALSGTVSPDPVVPTFLIGTYLVLTFAELLLSPMGISFVTKVAPPKMKGLMMGLWFAASAIGNYLSSIPGLLWMRVPLWANWAILAALCAVAGAIMFAMLRRIEAATK